MTKQRKYLLFALAGVLVLYIVYKILVEAFWVVKHETVAGDFNIKVSADEEFFGFQDFVIEKKVRLKNLTSGAEKTICFKSINFDEVYFYLDTLNTKKVIVILDIYLGESTYDYNTLTLIGEDFLNDEVHSIQENRHSGKTWVTFTAKGFTTAEPELKY